MKALTSNSSSRALPERVATATARLASPLQQTARVYVIDRGKKLSYFAGCDYFRLSSHPAVLAALRKGLEQFGLNVAASRKTTGNHLLYEQLEAALVGFFKMPSATLFSNGYMANLGVAQAMAGLFTHALIDEQAHSSLAEAARLLGCPVIPFRHRHVGALTRALRHLDRRARVLLLTDGLFAQNGQVAPLDQYLNVLPDQATVLVDDAHGAGILGPNGRGTPDYFRISSDRLIQTVTMSKAFGAYGGAVLGTKALRQRIVRHSRLFAGNTPVPLPLAAASLAALELVWTHPELRLRLEANAEYVKTALGERGYPAGMGPGPILAIHPPNASAARRLQRQLRQAGIFPSFINYRGGPRDGYFRFVFSSQHTRAQLEALAQVLAPLKT